MRAAAPARSAAATAPVLEPVSRRAPVRVRLTVVRPAPPGARKGPFVFLLLILLGAGLLGLLLLNLALMEGSFQESKLRTRAASLADAQQALTLQADQLSDPAALAAAAARDGMVPGGVPQYVAPGSPLPAGARVLSRSPEGGAILVIVPAPADQQAATQQPAASDPRDTTAATTGTSATTADAPAAGGDAAATGAQAGPGDTGR